MENSQDSKRVAINKIVIKLGPPHKPFAKIILPEKRFGPKDRRQVHTYIADDRRSGTANRRKSRIHLSHDRRYGMLDRRTLFTYTADDRRSGIADRRKRQK